MKGDTNQLFLERIKRVKNEIAGFEVIGEITEYYDEDEMLLLRTSPNYDEDGSSEFMIYDFGDEVFSFKKLEDIPA